MFKVGDKVVHSWHKKSKVQEVKSVNGDDMEVFHPSREYYYRVFSPDFRHATEQEIKLGHRLEQVNNND